jgi:hypothetical protein
VNFHTMPGHHHTADEQAEGVALQNACQTLFATMGIRSGSKWQLLNTLIPFARTVVSWLARQFPDQQLVQAREVKHIAFGRGLDPLVVLACWGSMVSGQCLG